MGRTMVKEDLTREQRDYCIHECRRGKEEAQRLLHTCEDVFDAVIDMQEFTKKCIEFPDCPLNKCNRENC